MKKVKPVKWRRLPAWTGTMHQGCLHARPPTRVAPMDLLIAVGFGCAQVTCDGEVVWDEMDADRKAEKCKREPRLWELKDAERAAAKRPRHDWRVLLEAPLRSQEYQRQGPKKWVLVKSGQGFA